MVSPVRAPRVQVQVPVSADGALALDTMSALTTLPSPREVAGHTVPDDQAREIVRRWTELPAWFWIWQNREDIGFADPRGQRLRVLLWTEGVRRARATGEVWTPWLDALDATGVLDRFRPHELQGFPSLESQTDRVRTWAQTAPPDAVRHLLTTCRGPRFAATVLRVSPPDDLLVLLSTGVLAPDTHEALVAAALPLTPDDTAQPAARTAFCLWALDRRAIALRGLLGSNSMQAAHLRASAERASATVHAAMDAPGGLSGAVIDRLLTDHEIPGTTLGDYEPLLFGVLGQPALTLAHLVTLRERIHQPPSLVAAIAVHPLATDADIWTPLALAHCGIEQRFPMAQALLVRRDPTAVAGCLQRFLNLGNPAGQSGIAECYVQAITHPAADRCLWVDLARWPDPRVREALARHAPARREPEVWQALLESRSAPILAGLLIDATGATYRRLLRRLITLDPDAALTVLERPVPADADLQTDDLGRFFTATVGASVSPVQQDRFFRVMAMLAATPTPVTPPALPTPRPRATR